MSDQIQAGFVSGRDSPGCSLHCSHDSTSEDCSRSTGLHVACSDSDFSLSLLFMAATGKHSPLRSLPSSEPWEFFLHSSHPTPKSCLDKCLADVLLCSLCNFILLSLFGVLRCIQGTLPITWRISNKSWERHDLTKVKFLPFLGLNRACSLGNHLNSRQSSAHKLHLAVIP